jgi:hypothetical protein
MEGEDTGWLSELEKKGLHQASGILENYGIDSETDVSLLDQGDLRNLVSQGMKPIQLKKIERWCDAVRPRADKTLFSSLNNPTVAALLSSEELNVMTLPSPCATVAESVSDNEGEHDSEEDGGEEDDDYSDNDLEIVFAQSGTADSTVDVSGGTEASVKKSAAFTSLLKSKCDNILAKASALRSSSKTNPVYGRRVNFFVLVCSLSSHRHSYIPLIFVSRFIDS